MLQPPNSPLTKTKPLDAGMIPSKKEACTPRHSLKKDDVHIKRLVRLSSQRSIQDDSVNKDMLKLSKHSRNYKSMNLEKQEVDKRSLKEEINRQRIDRLRQNFSRMRSLRDLDGISSKSLETVSLPPGIPAKLILKKPFSRQKSDSALLKRKSGVSRKYTDDRNEEPPINKGTKSRIQAKNDGDNDNDGGSGDDGSCQVQKVTKLESQTSNDNDDDGCSPIKEGTKSKIPTKSGDDDDNGNSRIKKKGEIESIPCCCSESDQDSSRLINPNTTLVVDLNGTTHITPKYSLKKKLDLDCLVGLKNMQDSALSTTNTDQEDPSLLDNGVLQFSVKKTREIKALNRGMKAA